jgi:hypothetical protein
MATDPNEARRKLREWLAQFPAIDDIAVGLILPDAQGQPKIRLTLGDLRALAAEPVPAPIVSQENIEDGLAPPAPGPVVFVPAPLPPDAEEVVRGLNDMRLQYAGAVIAHLDKAISLIRAQAEEIDKWKAGVEEQGRLIAKLPTREAVTEFGRIMFKAGQMHENSMVQVAVQFGNGNAEEMKQCDDANWLRASVIGIARLFGDAP